MRPLHLILGSTLTAAMVSGCASQSPEHAAPAPQAVAEEAAVTDTELPPGFYFNGEFVELGDFDPEGPVDLINMCDDLPDEVLHKAGMKRVELSGASKNPSGLTCTFVPSDEKQNFGSYGFMSDGIPLATFQEEGLLLNEEAVSAIPGLYTFTSNPFQPDQDCFASVTTERGRISFDYHDYSEPLSQDELCARAIQALEIVYFELRGKP